MQGYLPVGPVHPCPPHCPQWAATPPGEGGGEDGDGWGTAVVEGLGGVPPPPEGAPSETVMLDDPLLWYPSVATIW